MNVSTNELKKELSKWQNELEKHLSIRIHSLLDQIKNEDLAENQEISLFDLIVCIILRADEDPARHMANLLVPINTEKFDSLEEWIISDSAAFIRDYLKKDYIYHVLKTKCEGKRDQKDDTEQD